MENAINRWNKISSKSKRHHMFLSASLYRHVPLVLLLLTMAELKNKYRYVSINYLAANFVIKLVIAYIIGVYMGYLQWNDLENMIINRLESNKSFRATFIFRYGVCMFGTSIALANVNLFFMNIWINVFVGTIYMISGLVWGIMMSFIINRDVVK